MILMLLALILKSLKPVGFPQSSLSFFITVIIHMYRMQCGSSEPAVSTSVSKSGVSPSISLNI